MSFKINGSNVINESRVYTAAELTVRSVDGQIEVTSASPMQGTVAGFVAGGLVYPTFYNAIDRFPFATDTNATNVGSLINGLNLGAGLSSTTDGYVAGGFSFVDIEKFRFATSTVTKGVGYLTESRGFGSKGHSTTTHGYVSGGFPPSTGSNTIDRFPFAVDAMALDVGDLTLGRRYPATASSDAHGYDAGGDNNTPGTFYLNTIDRFSFAATANSSDVGDLATAKTYVDGQSSTTHGYTAGGTASPGTVTNSIEKYPFAATTNATSVASLHTSRASGAALQSTDFGYSAGGNDAASAAVNTIEKHSFSSDSNGTSVGSLASTVSGKNGQIGSQD